MPPSSLGCDAKHQLAARPPQLALARAHGPLPDPLTRLPPRQSDAATMIVRAGHGLTVTRRADCVARQAVQLAEPLGADSLRIDALTRLADVLHFQNRLADAEDCFDAARRFGDGVLTGIASVRWCEFLMTKQRFAEVGQQAETALEEPGSALDGLPHALHT